MIDPLAGLCDPLIQLGNKLLNLITLQKAEDFKFEVNR